MTRLTRRAEALIYLTALIIGALSARFGWYWT